MKKIRFLTALLLLVALSSFSRPVSAEDLTPTTGISGPVPPVDPTALDAAQADAELQSAIAQAAALTGLPALKAVIVVGPLDTAAVTQHHIAVAETAALAFEKYGVSVTRFYTPNDNWDQIMAAANGAHFFMYRGHGIAWGSGASATVGGISVDGIMHSNDEIRADLKLAQNAVVMIYSCFSSGSSDTDTVSISQGEAIRRVDEYSSPYFDVGASVVLTNWYDDAFATYINALFQGKTLGQAFLEYVEYPSTLYQGAHPSRSGLSLWMKSANWNPYPVPAPQYFASLTGQSSPTLTDLFAATMSLSNKSITVLAKPNTASSSFQVTVNANTTYAINWNASDAANWINTTPTSGTSGGAFNVQIVPGSSTGVYDSTVTVTTSDARILNPSEKVDVHLVVTNNIYKVYIPAVRR